MSDIFREVDEELRRDRLEQLWKRWGSVLIAAAVVVIAATAGYTVWRHWHEAAAAEETGRIVSALRLAGESPAAAESAAKAADALASVAAEAGGGREVVARLHEASFRMKAGDREAALRIYDDIASSDVEPAYRNLALLLSVLHRVDEGNPAELKARLAPLLDPANPWHYSAAELSALLSVRAGDRAAAAKEFRALADDAAAPAGVRSRADQLASLYAEPK